MSKFNNIEYHNYDNFEEKQPPIYRKLRIIDRKNENEEETQELLNNDDYASNDVNENCIPSVNINSKYNNSDSMRTVDLNSTMPYGYNKTENRYYDSLTNTSFNDINELNKLNEINFSEKKDSLIMEVEDTRNILKNNLQKVHERETKISDLDEKTQNLLDGSDKFNQSSKYLKRKMMLNYFCHLASIILTIVIIVTFILILTK